MIRPTRTRVSVTVEVIAQNHADLAEVKEAVEQALFRYFHPLRGGEKEQGWPFGGDIFFSLVYRLILSQPGVQRVEKLTISLDGEEAPECTDISIPDGVLLYSKTHEVAVRYDLEV
jgi:hypothetical protein